MTGNPPKTPEVQSSSRSPDSWLNYGSLNQTWKTWVIIFVKHITSSQQSSRAFSKLLQDVKTLTRFGALCLRSHKATGHSGPQTSITVLKEKGSWDVGNNGFGIATCWHPKGCKKGSGLPKIRPLWDGFNSWPKLQVLLPRFWAQESGFHGRQQMQALYPKRTLKTGIVGDQIWSWTTTKNCQGLYPALRHSLCRLRQHVDTTKTSASMRQLVVLGSPILGATLPFPGSQVN